MLFNETYYRDDKNLLDFDNGNIILRNAVRAIITNNNKILMVHLEKTNEYKFPGGGIEPNETINEALKREVLEEIGYNVIKIIEKIGIITEFAIAIEGGNNIFKMISEYYSVKIDPNKLEQKLDEYEKEYEYKPCWIEIEEAYNKNKELIENKKASTPWINRETIVLGILKEKYR